MEPYDIDLLLRLGFPIAIGALGGVLIGTAPTRRKGILRAILVVAVAALVGLATATYCGIRDDSKLIAEARARFSTPYVEHVVKLGPFFLEYAIEPDRTKPQPTEPKGGTGGFFRGWAGLMMELAMATTGSAVFAAIPAAIAGYVSWRVRKDRARRAAATASPASRSRVTRP